MKYKTLFILLLIFCAMSVSALSDNSVQSLIPGYISQYNALPEVPAVVNLLFKNEKINLYIDNSLVYGIVTTDGRVSSSSVNGLTDPSINIYVSQSTFDKIISGQLSYQDALKENLIKYEGATFINKIKLTLLGWLQGLFLK